MWRCCRGGADLEVLMSSASELLGATSIDNQIAGCGSLVWFRSKTIWEPIWLRGVRLTANLACSNDIVSTDRISDRDG